MSTRRLEANQAALRRFIDADPVLLDVQRALDVLPGMKRNMILTSGPKLAWEQYRPPQRTSILHAALYEQLAASVEEAEAKIVAGDIEVESNHDHGVCGAHAGIHTASMMVLVVEDRATGRRGHCGLFEGDAPQRLSQAGYGDDVVALQRFIDGVIGPTIGEALRRSGGLPVRPIVRRALNFGDDLHMRCSAATMLFAQALTPALLDVARERRDEVRRTVTFLEGAGHSFFRVELAMAKAITDGASGIEASSVLTRMAISCTGFSVQVSGLGDQWISVPQHPVFQGKLLPGVKPEDCCYYGTDSLMVEVLGFGAGAGAAGIPMQMKLGGTAKLVERNLELYRIATGEHPELKIPYFDFRGLPAAYDVFKIFETGITPYVNGGIGHRDGPFAGVGVIRTPIEVYQAAVAAYEARYGA